MHIVLSPLSKDEIAAMLSGVRSIGGVKVLPGALPPDAILESALAAVNAGKAAPWSAPLLFVLEASRSAVGSGGFKGEPLKGYVEIGYGVAETHRGCGFATEGVRQLVRLAFAQSEVTEVHAETATSNAASRRVLEKAGFIHAGQRDTEDDGTVDRWVLRKQTARSQT